MKDNITATDIKRYLDGLHSSAVARNAEWVAKFQTNPVYALEWSDAVFDDAARIEMAFKYINGVEYCVSKGMDDAEIVADIRRHLSRDFHFAAGKSNRSTSSGTNQMESARTTQLAKFSEWLNGR